MFMMVITDISSVFFFVFSFSTGYALVTLPRTFILQNFGRLITLFELFIITLISIYYIFYEYSISRNTFFLAAFLATTLANLYSFSRRN